MAGPVTSESGKHLSRGIPRTVWALGFVSLFMDVSSELVHSLLPLYMVGTLGISMLVVGIIEGVAQATALIVKVFSGALSDFIGRRKELLLLGYGLAALTKPLFPLAASAELVFSARLLDRIGKGIRGAPRDALVADVAPAEIRGACFGLRQSLDTVGAFVGPILAIGLMLLLANDIAQVLWLAVIPAALAVALLIFAIREPEHAPVPGTSTRHCAWPRCGGFPSITGGWWPSARPSPWPASARRSWCCGPSNWASPPPGCRW